MVSALSDAGVTLVGSWDDLTPVDVPGVDPASVSSDLVLDAALAGLAGVLGLADPGVVVSFDLRFFYDEYPRIEEAFGALVDQSLDPRGPSMLLQIVRELDLRPDSVALDVGCGEGAHSFRLATHFGLQVLGVDPVQRHLDLAREARRDVPEEIASRVTFGRGSAIHLPVADSSVDLVWCRDVLVHVPDLEAAYAEFARVLRPGGRAVIYQFVATPLLSAAEAAWLFPVMGVVPSSMSTVGHRLSGCCRRARRRRLARPRVRVG